MLTLDRLRDSPICTRESLKADTRIPWIWFLENPPSGGDHPTVQRKHVLHRELAESLLSADPEAATACVENLADYLDGIGDRGYAGYVAGVSYELMGLKTRAIAAWEFGATAQKYPHFARRCREELSRLDREDGEEIHAAVLPPLSRSGAVPMGCREPVSLDAV